MSRRYSKQPWRCRKSRRIGWALEIRNGHSDPIAVVYSNEDDADAMTHALQYRASLKQALVMLGQFEPQLSPSRKSRLNAFRDLLRAH